MRHLLLAAAMFALAPAVLAEDPAPAAPGKALAFRLEVGVAPGKFIPVRLVESGEVGPGIDAALLDLDGDGTFETRQVFTESTDAYSKKPVRDTKVRVRHEDADWVLEFTGLRFNHPAVDSVGAVTYAHWSVQKDDLYAWFINAQVRFDTTGEGAEPAKPFRMGPPIRFETGTSTRGPDAMVSVGLKDANGGTLRLARRGTVEIRPEVKLVQEDAEVFSATATYG